MSQHHSLYEFDSFRIDSRERLLLREGEQVPLSSKVFDVLLALVRRSGHLIEKEEFFEQVWPDTHVEEGNIARNISTLRRLLGRSPSGQPYIVTVPGRGYRFVGNVREIQPDAGVAGNGSTEIASSSEGPLNSIAVLPFVNSSDDRNVEYLSDGITDSIIHLLSQLKGLRVLGRGTMFQYKGQQVDPLTVGRSLGVRSVLSGRALHVADRVVIRAELTDVENGCDVWGGQFDRPLSDLLVIQEEIARDISEKLRIKLTAETQRILSGSYTSNQAAYHAYLKGRFYWGQHSTEGMRKARAYFERAIEADPTFALAWAGLADSYYVRPNLARPARQAMLKAKAAATRALELDEHLAEAHVSLAYIKMFYDWDWPGAETEAKRAIALNPNYPYSHGIYGLYLRLMGRFEESIAEMRKAHEVDPLSVQISVSLGANLYFASRNDEAIAQLLDSLEMNPSYYPARFHLGMAYQNKGDYPRAIAEFEAVASVDEATRVLAMAAIGYVSAASGDNAKTLEVLDELRRISATTHVSPFFEAIVLLGLGQLDDAFQRLDQALEERSDMLAYLKVGPWFDRLRDDPRYAKLLERVGLHDDKLAAPLPPSPRRSGEGVVRSTG